MGCGASSGATVSAARRSGNPYTIMEQQWEDAHRTLVIKQGKRYPASNLVVKRTGWKTIRVFVSSTFRDFHMEREVLVKKVRSIDYSL